MYCEGVHHSLINEFKEGLKHCFARANSLGLDVSIVPHLDEGVRKNAAWRNAVVFDPLQKWVSQQVWMNV